MGFIKFLIEDFKSDLKFFIKICKGEAKINPKQVEALKGGWGKTLKDHWLMFLIILLAFLSGWWMASQYYQMQCNNYIYETYLKQTINFTLN